MADLVVKFNYLKGRIFMAYSNIEIGAVVERRIAAGIDVWHDQAIHCDSFAGIVIMPDGAKYSVLCDWPVGSDHSHVVFDVEPIGTD